MIFLQYPFLGLPSQYYNDYLEILLNIIVGFVLTQTISQCPFHWLPHRFLSKSQYAVLSHFKSKGISVFLTQQQGQALRVRQKISTHSGRIFWQNLAAAKHYLFMLVKRNKAYSGSLNE